MGKKDEKPKAKCGTCNGQGGLTVGGRWIDRHGRRVEVITLDRGHGPREWVRVSWRGVLLGCGYYRSIAAALALVDAESLVEVIELRPLPVLDRPRAVRGVPWRSAQPGLGSSRAGLRSRCRSSASPSG